MAQLKISKKIFRTINNADENSLRPSPFLPGECLQEIFSYFHDDTLILSKCLLVNKFWFENAASILWKSPFGHLHTPPSMKLIETCLKFLDARLKNALAQIGIPLSPFKSFTPEFIYAPYVKELCYKGLYDAACDFIFNSNDYYVQNRHNNGDGVRHRRKDLKGERRSLILVGELSLFFIRKCPSIDMISYDTEEINFYAQDLYLSSLNSMSEAYQLFKRVKKLTFGGKYEKGTLMNNMSRFCKNLRTLELNFYEFDMYDLDGDQKEPNKMSTLLSMQKALNNLTIRGPFRYLSNFLTPLKSQARTLSHIGFERVRFNNSLPLESVTTCINLETLIFEDCVNLNDKTLAPLALASFHRLKKLVFKNAQQLYLDNLARLIKNTQGSLQEIRFRRREFKNMVVVNVPDIPVKLIEVISLCCPNLIIFEGHVEKESMPHFLKIYASTFLEKLFISVEYKNGKFFRSQVAFQLPDTLRHLSISTMDYFSAKDLEQFLTLCSAPLESLQFPQSSFINDEYLDLIIEFAKKVLTLKLVTFSKISFITEKGIRRARKFISFVRKNGEEYV
ncbi:19832_t:CDS:1 [Funneliformis geosporum]|uniref:16094_t:CDS:1 n=1 Tax=Funneliformis geosporum TaxID=1117311 RepID=A0A9W4SP65_9GLOM|nr:19832_t:CDS:1 [Funneliformis geosporum]CAI2177513.1 16094_t:CDS:1 [Funneliformis geosporum]